MDSAASGSKTPSLSFALRPAVPAAVAFVVGVSLHRTLPHVPAVWIGLTLLAALLALPSRNRAAVCSILLIFGLLSIGAAAAQLYAFQFPADEITLFASDEPRLANLELEIITAPRILTDPFNVNRALPPKQVANARVQRIKTWSGWIPASGDVLLQISQPQARLQVGQHVSALGFLDRPAPAMNPGQFDWAGYYREQRIVASFHVQQASNIQTLDEGGQTVLDGLRSRARELLAAGFPTSRSLDHALLRALLLGDSDPQLRDVQEQFQRTGTSHHLAISGMHVAVLGGFVFLICRMLCLSPRRTAVISTAFVIVYGLAALPSPPVIRSVLLCSAVGIGLILRRSTDYLQLLAVTVLAMLVLYPLDLYNAGFELSFGTVLGMILLTPAVHRAMVDMMRDRDVEIARSFTPSTAWSRVRDRADGLITTSLAAGVVAWLVSMPLIAVHFEQLNPWAVPASIILAPIVLLALVFGFLKILFTLLWPSGAAMWVTLCAFPITWMRATVDWLASWPRSDVPIPPPPLWMLFAYYGLLLTMIVPWPRASTIWLLRIARVGMLLALLWLPYESDVAHRRVASDSLRVTLLAVGAGQCAVVEPPSGRVVVVDAGSSGLSDLVTKCLGPYLRHAGCTSVDSIFLSHTDYDHIGAAATVTRAYQVREVMTGLHFLEHAAESAPAERMLKELDAMQRPPRVLEPGQRIPLGRDTAVEVLWPPGGPGMPIGNDESLVLKITHAGRSILFPGDIQDGAMRELLKHPGRIRSDVLVAAHHGSSESLTRAFVEAVNPSVIVSSNDRTLSRKQVDFESMIGKRPLMRTHRAGAITIEIDAEGELHVTPYLPRSYQALEFRRISASTP
jgi:competence protein ComEC